MPKLTDPIVGVYQLIVYASGKIETIPKPLDSISDPIDLEMSVFNPSSRTSQIISLIEKVTNHLLQYKKFDDLDEKDLNRVISKTCYEVAEEYGVTLQTILDKISRQLGISKEQFTTLLFDFYQRVSLGKTDESMLKILLLQHSSRNNKNDDFTFLTYKFDKIEKEIIRMLGAVKE